MMTEQPQAISMRPVISYPRHAEPGKTYLLMVDIESDLQNGDWPYDREEYTVFCTVDGGTHFAVEAQGVKCRESELNDTAPIVIHRFGGTYGPARFFVTASDKDGTATFKIALISGWGVPLLDLALDDIVIGRKDSSRRVISRLRATTVARPVEPPSEVVEVADPPIGIENTLLHRYLRRLRQRCNSLSIAAPVGVEGFDEVVLDSVYVSLDIHSHGGYSSGETQSAGRKSGTQPMTAVEATAQHSRLVLLGDPGSGKSLFVRQLASRLAASLLGEQHSPGDWSDGLMPILVALRDFTPYLAKLELEGQGQEERHRLLMSAIRAYWLHDLQTMEVEDFAPTLEDALKNGAVLLMFDGLDEVYASIRPQVREAIQAVSMSYPAIQRIVVTCRVLSYAGKAVLPGYAVETLAPFSEENIKRFVEAWYRAQMLLGRVNAEQGERYTQDLQRAVLSGDLRELAGNPMLLTTMAIIHQRGVGLPLERVRLYTLAVEVLLSRWQKYKGMQFTPALAQLLRDDSGLRSILEHLAYLAHQRQADGRQSGELDRSEILAVLEGSNRLGDIGLAAEFLDYVNQRAGLLVTRGVSENGGYSQSYSFVHRIFQEYLAGCHMVTGRSMAREYWQRAKDGDFWQLAALLGAEELIFNRRSERDLLDLAYNLCPAVESADEQSRRAALWSGQMAALLGRATIESDTGNPDGGKVYLRRLYLRLAGILRRSPLPPIERAETGRVLAKLGDPRAYVGLGADGLPDIDWQHVPAGEFIMGSTKQTDKWSNEDEAPQHRARLTAFSIAKYPITNAQYDAFVVDGGYTDRWRHCWIDQGWQEKGTLSGPETYGGFSDLPNHPVVGVSWYEAVAFCNWLTEKLGRPVSLPTEAQWEMAARGTDGRRYPWGGDFTPDHANTVETGIGATTAVGVFPRGASPYGCEDMSGNVREWCGSKWQSRYPLVSDDQVAENFSRSVRGGAFDSKLGEARCAAREAYPPGFRNDDLGFRVVVTAASGEQSSGIIVTANELRERFLAASDPQLRQQLYSRLAEDSENHSFLLNQHALRLVDTIRPADEEVKRAHEIVDHLRSRLSAIRAISDAYAETVMFGSFARETAIRPLSDVDAVVIFRIDPDQEGPKTTYEILDVLLKRIYASQVMERRRIVDKRNPQGSSFGASFLIHLPDMWFEVTPAVFDRRNEGKILVPDRSLGRWSPTNHEIHAQFSDRQNKHSDGAYSCLVRMLKWWQHHNSPWKKYLTGFVLECLVAAHADPEKSALLPAFERLFRQVRERYQTPGSLWRVPELGVPRGYKFTNISRANHDQMMSLIKKTLAQIEQANEAEDIASKIEIWRSIFGVEFPETVI